MPKHRLVSLLAPGFFVLLGVIWYLEYFVSGALPLAEWGNGNLWTDWVVNRNFIKGLGIVPEWNPLSLAGLSHIGRDPFFSPISLANVFMFFFPDPKLEWVFIAIVIAATMGFGMFMFLGELGVRTELRVFGGVIFMMANKWIDDLYQGPHFGFAYAVLPWIMILIHRIFTRGQRPVHFLLLGISISVAYLGSGGAVLVFIGQLFIPFFLYMLLLRLIDRKGNRVRLLSRLAAWAPALGVMFVGLSAYLLFPFWGTYAWFDQRTSLSAYGQPGFDWQWYFGIIFPWTSRIFGDEFYDMTYPSIFGYNYSQYLNILLIPVIALAIRQRLWDRTVSFFLVLPLLWMFFLSKWVTAIFPVAVWIELKLRALSVYNNGHIIYIFSGAVFLSWSLHKLLERPEVFSGRGGLKDRITSGINFGIIGLYAAAVAFFIGGYILVHTPVWNLFADRYFAFSQNVSGVTYKLYMMVRLLFYYYFDSRFFWFHLLIFLSAIAQVWLFHKNYLSRRWGLLALVLIAALNYQMNFRVHYPFSQVMERRFGNVSYQNRFILDKVLPTERVGGNGMGIIWNNWGPLARRTMSDPRYLTAPIEVVREEARNVLFDGYFEPMLDVPLSYYPVTVGRNSFNAHQSFMPAYWLDFYKFMNRGSDMFQKAEVASQNFNFESLYDPSSKLVDVAGIKYLFWSAPLEDKRYVQAGEYQIGRYNTFYIYDNQSAVPKAYLVSNVEYFPDRGVALERLGSNSFDPLASVVTEDAGLAKQFDGGPASRRVSGPVDVMEYSANRVSLRATTPDKALLVLNDMFYPFWSARVDGTLTEIYRVNVAFRGIILAPGTHTIEFEFRNPLFHTGVYVSAGMWIIVIGALVWLLLYERRRSGTWGPS